ncbi:hypothetical protein A5722_21620 [Mycobacterium vulneris]|nr:hypothetical protein A5722_21620 [Mycolicibacterium vulneris]OCB64870.1 hypothetical protein A5729_19185 [Mycolicibacterium vulneris]
MTNFSNWPGPDPTRGAPPQRFDQPAPQTGFGGAAPLGGPPPTFGGPQPAPNMNFPKGFGGPPPVTPTPGRPAKNRKPLIITAGATVAVLTVIAVIVAFLMNKGEDGVGFNPSGSPVDVAKSYLEALSRGDAQAALDLSATEPATTDFLTNDILKMQLGKLPITDAEVVEQKDLPEADKRTAVVKVAAKFGGQRTEGELEMVVIDNQWKLATAFVNGTTEDIIGYGDPEADAALTVFGKPLPKSRHFYVFPGYLQMGAATPYLNINELPPTTLADVGSFMPTMVKPKFSMNDQGLKAAQDALRAWIDKCLNPGGDKSDDCKTLINGSWASLYDPNTIRVSRPYDLPPDLFRLPDHTSLVQIGSLSVPINVVQKSTGQPVDVDLGISDQVKVNLGEQPPRVFLDR